MASEQRLIDANKLESKLQEHHDFFADGVGGFRFLSPKDKARVDEITNCIAEVVNSPTVDAVEVVRCKDCKSWKQYNACDGTKPHRCMNHNAIFYKRTAPDDFCSYGERRSDGSVHI